jgi:transposase
MDRKPYPTDLTDQQWRRMKPWVPVDAATGRPSKYTKREIVNAILYVTRNGCTWRGLPHAI